MNLEKYQKKVWTVTMSATAAAWSTLCLMPAGTVMTPNYVRSRGLSLSPWCDCSGSGNGKPDCERFLELFTNNRCLRESSYTSSLNWSPFFGKSCSAVTTASQKNERNFREYLVPRSGCQMKNWIKCRSIPQGKNKFSNDAFETLSITKSFFFYCSFMNQWTLALY